MTLPSRKHVLYYDHTPDLQDEAEKERFSCLLDLGACPYGAEDYIKFTRGSWKDKTLVQLNFIKSTEQAIQWQRKKRKECDNT